AVGMEETEFDDILDDWFIESLKTYRDLYVYQLEQPTKVIEWTSGKSVCIAGYSSSKNEIMELCLPPKLFADENKALCAERDFRVVHGGLTDGPVHCLRHIPGTRCVVTNDGRSSDLQVWELEGDNSDVIRRTGSLEGRRGVSEGGSRIAAQCSLSQPQVLHGATSSDVQLTQLTSGQPLFKLETTSADPLSSLQFVSDSVFLASCCNGSIYITDIRISAAPQLFPPPASSGDSTLWWTDATAGLSTCKIVRLSSFGQVEVSDLRNPGRGAVSRAQLDIQTHHCNFDNIRVSWAPVLDGYIAVSGFGGTVQIYNSSVWRSELQEAQPLFEHRGHSVSSLSTDGITVTSHVWHPEWPRMLLSAASDSSVHVWDWIDPSVSDGN
uniref:WD repeat domain 73 n=1 Tax=Mola mola TaxID=94237 RepID=A0A3Q3W5Q1_MOLML